MDQSSVQQNPRAGDDEFVGRHNIRDLDTLDQMAAMAKRIHGTRLSYKALVA
jgi:hypothetical protein